MSKGQPLQILIYQGNLIKRQQQTIANLRIENLRLQEQIRKLIKENKELRDRYE